MLITWGQAKMRSSNKMTDLALIGITLTTFFVTTILSLHGCAPKPVPLGVTLDTPEHHLLTGMKLIELGRLEDALREFDLTKRSDPTFSKAYVGCGLVFAYQNNWNRAHEELEKAEKLARTDEEKVFVDVATVRLFIIGKEFVARDWLAAAESAFNDAVTRMPESSHAHFYMGRAYEEAGNLTKASVLYEKVLHINNTHVGEAKAALNRMKCSKGNQI